MFVHNLNLLLIFSLKFMLCRNIQNSGYPLSKKNVFVKKYFKNSNAEFSRKCRKKQFGIPLFFLNNINFFFSNSKFGGWVGGYLKLLLLFFFEVILDYRIEHKKFPSSIMKINGNDIWDEIVTNIAEKDYTLNNIEHGILRHMDDQRIHSAIVCSSKTGKMFFFMPPNFGKKK